MNRQELVDSTSQHRVGKILSFRSVAAPARRTYSMLFESILASLVPILELPEWKCVHEYEVILYQHQRTYVPSCPPKQAEDLDEDRIHNV